MAPASSPTPHAASKPKPSPTPAPPVEKLNSKLAENMERQERYGEAAKVYEDYLARNPNASDADTVGSYIGELRRMQAALAAADSAMSSQLYALARKHYRRALELRPGSQRAKTGIDEAEAKIRSMLPPRIRRRFPFDRDEFPRGGARRGRFEQRERQ
jgi:tetratricopeptide (TPR) repeat protein